MKIIGKIIRGYFLFLFYAFVFVTVFDTISPGYRDTMKAIRDNSGDDDKNYKKKSVKLTATTSSPNYYEFIRGKELSMSYTCEYKDGSSFGSISSVESVSPGTYSLMIEREIENKREPSMFDNDICSEPIDDFSTIEAVDVVVKITPQ